MQIDKDGDKDGPVQKEDAAGGLILQCGPFVSSKWDRTRLLSQYRHPNRGPGPSCKNVHRSSAVGVCTQLTARSEMRKQNPIGGNHSIVTSNK
ncbi:hypothetical protein SCLCIDRAFT_1218089 [Scleroderma citrinum Foug A]|uniref:Uncharacterized protein n=1 Tax=Scleroderma citrinum Foug A TaxID=1036808 RepID=A0A0C3DEK2_9AGAM|nr:hypothetical protein SCLCIDRAFT_1218089 [Scleroderma citrinum Foug A]